MVNSISFRNAILSVSVFYFLAAIIYAFVKNFELMGLLLGAGFVTASIGFKTFESVKKFSYPAMIFAAVTMALTLTQYFITINGFALEKMILPVMQIIMFGMGTAISIHDFIGVAKNPRGVFVGVTSHFIIMPSLGFLLASIFPFSPEIAAGIILIGCSPAGMASNVMSYMAKANLALSITITTVSTLLAPLFTPLLMKFLAGELINIEVFKMMFDIFKIVIIPICLGLLFNKLFSNKIKWMKEVMPVVSMTGIAFIIVVITAAGRNSLLEIGILLILSSIIHNTAGYAIGYWSARLFKMAERDCRTVAIEVGMQNGGLASGIAREMGKIATVGLASAVFGPLMNITGSLLASWWKNRDPDSSAMKTDILTP